MKNIDIFSAKLNVAMHTSYSAIRDVLEEAYTADGWTDGEYILFLQYVDNFII